jgi:hypothetical protein
MGGNRCALFGRTYLELLGLFADGSVDPSNIRPLIAKYEGLHGCSFGCGDLCRGGDGARTLGTEPVAERIHRPRAAGRVLRRAGEARGAAIAFLEA